MPSPYHSTGGQNIRESNAELLGDEVMSKTGPVYGLDKEGEINGSYRPCGHPGVSISHLFNYLSVDHRLPPALVRYW